MFLYKIDFQNKYLGSAIFSFFFFRFKLVDYFHKQFFWEWKKTDFYPIHSFTQNDQNYHVIRVIKSIKTLMICTVSVRISLHGHIVGLLSLCFGHLVVVERKIGFFFCAVFERTVFFPDIWPAEISVYGESPWMEIAYSSENLML